MLPPAMGVEGEHDPHDPPRLLQGKAVSRTIVDGGPLRQTGQRVHPVVTAARRKATAEAVDYSFPIIFVNLSTVEIGRKSARNGHNRLGNTTKLFR